MKKNRFFIVVFSVLSLHLLIGGILMVPVWAADLTSTNFIIRDPIIQGGGGYGSSASFQVFSAIAQMNVGESSSTANQEQSGFMYFSDESNLQSSGGSSGSSAAAQSGSSGLTPGGRGLFVGSTTTAVSTGQQTIPTSSSGIVVPESVSATSSEIFVQKNNVPQEASVLIVSSSSNFQGEVFQQHSASSVPSGHLPQVSVVLYFGKNSEVPLVLYPTFLFIKKSNILTLIIGSEIIIFCIVICYWFPRLFLIKKKTRR
jgi:hypothetical protein